MPVTLAIPFADAKKRPPPLPVTDARADAREQNSDVAASSAPPPLPSMRVPKGIIVHDAQGDEIDVHAAVLKARRATEELEWQAQVKRAKDSLSSVTTGAVAPARNEETAEWDALRTRMRSVQTESTPRAPQPKKPPRKLAMVPPPAAVAAAPSPKLVELAPAPVVRLVPAIDSDEEREWQELRARARLVEEREWEELIARARTNSVAPTHPFDTQPVQRSRPPRARTQIVAWP